MATVTQDDVLSVLKRIAAPDGRGNVVSAGLVSDIAIQGGTVMFALTTSPQHVKTMEALRGAVEKAVLGIPGVDKAMVALTAERAAQQGGQPQQAQQGQRGTAIPGIRHLIAVSSGKGGVGKSTTAVNLALALKSLGLRVAVLDADVYGPSIPKLFGLTGKPEPSDAAGKKMKPMTRYGVEVMSIGFLVPEDTPMIWRGPMVMSALTQLLRETEWGEADVMVIDMPPGTGDVQLTLVQKTRLDGAVIVSTPQEVALADARRAVAMFGKIGTPVLGLVENMAFFPDPSTGAPIEIFGRGGARAEAERLGAPFLGEIPIDPALRQGADQGRPLVATAPESATARAFAEIAERVAAALAAA